MQNLAKIIRRWSIRGYEAVLLCLGGVVFVVTEFGGIRNDLSDIAQMQLDSWIGTLFGICSVSYFHKAW